VEDGSLDASQRANRLWKERLASYQPPALDDAIDAELQEYIAKRKAVLPDTFG
jgi:trimethylamine---corrinoid protein Co-methyltransferase